MKRFLSLFLVAIALIGCCSFAFIQPVSAAESETVSGKYQFNTDFTGFSKISSVVTYAVTQDVTVLYNNVVYDMVSVAYNEMYLVSYSTGDAVNIFGLDDTGSYYWEVETPVIFDFGDEQSVSSDFKSILMLISAPVAEAEPEVPVSSTPAYYAVYDLIVSAFYGDGEITGWQELVATSLATFAVVFMFALPFLVVFLLIRMIGVWR